MRIVIEPGGYHCLNVGDVAMMQISIERLTTFWPDASIQVVTSAPDLLRESSPNALPIPDEERNGWVLRSRQARSGLSALARRYTKASIGARRFATRLVKADLLLVSGAGYFNDVWEQHAHSVLDVIDAAISSRIPTVLMGQGIGPMNSERLRRRMAETFRGVALIALRERLEGSSILRSLGVNPSRIVVTGDDAIELAFRHRSRQQRTSLGINIRRAPYVGLDGSDLDNLLNVLGAFADAHPDVQLLPIVVSHHPGDQEITDLRFVRQGQRRSSRPARASFAYVSPEEVVRTTGRCRLVLASTYHASVFAASQGIPVVAAANSDYYRGRFRGLNELFGEGVRMVDLAEEGRAKLLEAIDEMWTRADELRPALLGAAVDQIDKSHTAYEHVRHLVEA